MKRILIFSAVLFLLLLQNAFALQIIFDPISSNFRANAIVYDQASDESYYDYIEVNDFSGYGSATIQGSYMDESTTLDASYTAFIDNRFEVEQFSTAIGTSDNQLENIVTSTLFIRSYLTVQSEYDEVVTLQIEKFFRTNFNESMDNGSSVHLFELDSQSSFFGAGYNTNGTLTVDLIPNTAYLLRLEISGQVEDSRDLPFDGERKNYSKGYIEFATVPEPSMLALYGIGVLGLFFKRKFLNY